MMKCKNIKVIITIIIIINKMDNNKKIKKYDINFNKKIILIVKLIIIKLKSEKYIIVTSQKMKKPLMLELRTT